MLYDLAVSKHNHEIIFLNVEQYNFMVMFTHCEKAYNIIYTYIHPVISSHTNY